MNAENPNLRGTFVGEDELTKLIEHATEGKVLVIRWLFTGAAIEDKSENGWALNLLEEWRQNA